MKHEVSSSFLTGSLLKAWIALVVLLFGTGCATGGTPGMKEPGAPRMAMRTDAATYVLASTGPMQRPGFEMVVTYRNTSGERRILDTCDKRPPRWYLEKRIGEEWVPAYEPACTLIAPEHPPAIAPGATRTDTLVIVDHGPDLTRFTAGAVPGTYRIVYVVSAEAGHGAPQQLPLEQRASNEFEIRESLP